MAVVGWRVYYTDSRVYTSERTNWKDLPEDGVLLLKLYYDEWANDRVRYTKVLSGDDYYFHVPDSDIFGCNNDPPSETVSRYDGLTKEYIKRGKWTTREEMEAVRERAQAASWQ